MNKRKRNRINRRIAKNKAKLFNLETFESYEKRYYQNRLPTFEPISYEPPPLEFPTDAEIMKILGLTRIPDIFFGSPTPTTKKAPAPKGKIPWYDQAIKKCYSWIEKICKNQGYYGEDKYRQVEAPVPDEIKDYLEDEEIDFKLREKDDIPK